MFTLLWQILLPLYPTDPWISRQIIYGSGCQSGPFPRIYLSRTDHKNKPLTEAKFANRHQCLNGDNVTLTFMTLYVLQDIWTRKLTKWWHSQPLGANRFDLRTMASIAAGTGSQWQDFWQNAWAIISKFSNANLWDFTIPETHSERSNGSRTLNPF
jgi:hypothetical protein